MKQKIHFRKAQKSDIPEILSLYRQPEMDGDNTLSIDNVANVLDQTEQYPFYHFYLAFYEGQVKPIGIFGLLIMDNIGHHGTPSGIVEGVCVAEECQGQGVGKAMMQHAMKLCEQQGCYKIFLSSNLRRERAHEFYRTLGFEQHGIGFKVELKSTGNSGSEI